MPLLYHSKSEANLITQALSLFLTYRHQYSSPKLDRVKFVFHDKGLRGLWYQLLSSRLPLPRHVQ